MTQLTLRSFLFAVVGAFFLLAHAAEAQSIRYYVRQSTGLFEVVDGSNTGGRFVVKPTGESIFVPGKDGGLLPVRGYTDRAARGEYFTARGLGSGIATFKVTRTDERGNVYLLISNTGTLPTITPLIQVSTDPNWDRLTGIIEQNGRVAVARRLPIGTR